MTVEGEHIVEQGVAHHLIHGVVAAHVLAQYQQVALRVEQGCRVQSARLREARLCLPQRAFQRVQHPHGHSQAVAEHGPTHAHTRYLLDAGLAAQPARRVRIEVAAPAPRFEQAALGGRHVDDIGGRSAVLAHAVGDVFDVVPACDHPFGEQEARGQLEIVAGGAHGHGHIFSGQPYLHRLLYRQQVLGLPALSAHVAVYNCGCAQVWVQIRGHRALPFPSLPFPSLPFLPFPFACPRAR